MCSVAGCTSLAQRFTLPRDPERRLEWVKFLATANEQQFKESSWKDFTICCDHFTNDCFENVTANRYLQAGMVRFALKQDAVPSLCAQPGVGGMNVLMNSEESELEPQIPLSNSASSFPSACTSPVPRILSTDTSDILIKVYGQMDPQNVNFGIITEKAARAQMKGKFVVNEARILQLFPSFCPLCGSVMKMVKTTNGVLITLKQLCLLCEYKHEWKSQVDASVPEVERSSETQEDIATPSASLGASDTCDVENEDSENLDDTGESSDQAAEDSDEDWEPSSAPILTNRLQEEEESADEDQQSYFKNRHLCEECGALYVRLGRHSCEHKIKPFSCNLCGQRVTTESALKTHSRIHSESYSFSCKYCNVAIKTKPEKIKHEETHENQEKPYKCPDCSDTFVSHSERKEHLMMHRGSPQLQCDICQLEFVNNSGLRRHYVVHTGLKAFKCNICQRSFSQESHLKSHVRLHTGERPFKCQQCDKSFNHNSSLKNHIQRYHTAVCESEQNNREIEMEPEADDAERRRDRAQPDNATKECKSKNVVTKFKRRYTGRPPGRPKRNATVSTVASVKKADQCSHPENVEKRLQVVKRKRGRKKGGQGR